MAVTFDLNEIFQFCFDILKGNINSVYLSIQIFNSKWHAKMTKLIFPFLARQFFDDIIMKNAYFSKCHLT